MASREEINQLRRWVKIGYMDGVREWVEAGKPLLEPEGSRRVSILEMAVDTGFYSMIELLASVWPCKNEVNYLLCRSLHKRYIAVARLLIALGADVNYPSLDEVASCYDKELMRFFLDRVDDPCANDGLASAVTERVWPLIGILREYAEKLPGGKIQLTKALKDFVIGQDKKWISLTQWMGADPRLRVPNSNQTEEDREEWQSPLEEAFTVADLDIIRCFKLDLQKVKRYD